MKISGSAGHGLNTAGKRTPDDSMREFMFNLAVFNYFKAEIEQYKDSKGSKVQVIGVHDTTGKTDISLQKRSAQVNIINPALHIDFHANASSNNWSNAEGVETFVYKKTLKEAVKVAEAVQKEVVAATGLKNRGVKEGDLHMIRETKPTAILVEGPFMNNKKEAELLKSDQFRRTFASAIVKGVVKEYGLTKVVTATPSTPKDTKQYRILSGTFAHEEGAYRGLQAMQDTGMVKVGYIKPDGNFFRVLTGVYVGRESVEKAVEVIKKATKYYLNIVDA